jgi:hypothetical protein
VLAVVSEGECNKPWVMSDNRPRTARDSGKPCIDPRVHFADPKIPTSVGSGKWLFGKEKSARARPNACTGARTATVVAQRMTALGASRKQVSPAQIR